MSASAAQSTTQIDSEQRAPAWQSESALQLRPGTDDRQPAHTREVHALVRIPSGGGAVPEPGERDSVLLTDLEGELGADCDGQHRGQMAHHRHQAEVVVCEVDVAVLPARRAVGLAHVVREDPPGLDTAHDLDAEIAMERRTDTPEVWFTSGELRAWKVSSARICSMKAGTCTATPGAPGTRASWCTTASSSSRVRG